MRTLCRHNTLKGALHTLGHKCGCSRLRGVGEQSQKYLSTNSALNSLSVLLVLFWMLCMYVDDSAGWFPCHRQWAVGTQLAVQSSCVLSAPQYDCWYFEKLLHIASSLSCYFVGTHRVEFCAFTLLLANSGKYHWPFLALTEDTDPSTAKLIYLSSVALFLKCLQASKHGES